MISPKLPILLLLFAITTLFVQETAECIVLEDSINGYRVTYPEGWIAQKFSDNSSVIKAEINKDGSAGVQVRIYYNKNGEFNSFVDEYVDKFIKDMQSHWGGMIEIIERRYAQIGKYKGFIISFDFLRKDNQRWFFKQYLWPRKNKVYLFQCGTTHTLRSIDEPALDFIAESMEFIDQSYKK